MVLGSGSAARSDRDSTDRTALRRSSDACARGDGIAALGVDVGGTFTDIALWDGENVTVGKVLTTPHDQSDAVMAGAGTAVPPGASADLFHGTTVATNALLERRGARTLLVSDAGFESLIEIARQDRPSLYDPFTDRPIPLVEPELRIGVDIPEAADDTAIDDAADDISKLVARHNAEAVAVCLMYSYSDPSRENRLCRSLRERLNASLPVSASAQITAEFREYERFSTAVLNAFLSPEVALYMKGLEERAQQAAFVERLSVMRSSGGLVSVGHASEFPVSILLSGPAGGVVACAALGERMGCDSLISFDMGGTSTDVCRVLSGRPQAVYNREIAGHACLMPSVAVNTVGAGGGSIAWADSGGALKVGPRSAGAVPGPACYGRGGAEPTVTDANLVLGRLDPAATLADEVPLHRDSAFAACERLGSRLSLGAVEAALGVVSVVESRMAHAVRSVSVEQGVDPRDAVLVAFGGAGGLHATALARSLSMSGVVIPPYAGVFSAFGLLLSAPRADLAQTINLSAGDFSLLASTAERLSASARSRLKTDSGRQALSETLIVDMRYSGQSHETHVPYRLGEPWNSLCKKFHRLHAQRNGFSLPDSPVEAVTVRAEAVGAAALDWADLPEFAPEPGDPKRPPRTVVTPSGPVEAEVWWRPALAPDTTVAGPAVIEEGQATTYVDLGEQASVHETGALRIQW